MGSANTCTENMTSMLEVVIMGVCFGVAEAWFCRHWNQSWDYNWFSESRVSPVPAAFDRLVVKLRISHFASGFRKSCSPENAFLDHPPTWMWWWDFWEGHCLGISVELLKVCIMSPVLPPASTVFLEVAPFGIKLFLLWVWCSLWSNLIHLF